MGNLLPVSLKAGRIHRCSGEDPAHVQKSLDYLQKELKEEPDLRIFQYCIWSQPGWMAIDIHYAADPADSVQGTERVCKELTDIIHQDPKTWPVQDQCWTVEPQGWRRLFS